MSWNMLLTGLVGFLISYSVIRRMVRSQKKNQPTANTSVANITVKFGELDGRQVVGLLCNSSEQPSLEEDIKRAIKVGTTMCDESGRVFKVQDYLTEYSERRDPFGEGNDHQYIVFEVELLEAGSGENAGL